MPVLVQTTELQPGMKLCDSIVRHGVVMLPGNRFLTKPEVQVLARRFPHLRVRVGDPLLDSLVEFENDADDRQVASEAQRKIAEIMGKVSQRFAQRADVSSINFTAMQDSAHEVMQYIKDNPVSAVLINQGLDADEYLSE
ncbi:MAG: hypothetical protein IT442_12820, partial [Phycisphaeraceae bacterium]|nr:hypothetical protein [Phycisphaeraceae bacterium]